MAFDLDSYETVASRFNRFIEWVKLTDYIPAVTSEMMSAPGAEICVFKTTIFLDGVIVATGHAEEVRGAGSVNRTSHVENCETSSLGRCLANFPLHNFAGSDFAKRPSREEMSKVERTVKANPFVTSPAGTATTMPATENTLKVKGAQHGPLPEWLFAAAAEQHITEVYDNRDTLHENPKRPWFKCTQSKAGLWAPKGTPLPIIDVSSYFPTDEEPF
jgi:hypothetical protein